ncbi:MAG: sigma 54-interacting transcriptional regulator [Prevotella sp.]|nr:sigma 54-interacting transcriptional regulator [Prevotella sp.]
MGNPTWDEFSGKNTGRKNAAFEALARLLFRTRYGLGDSLPYFKNHSGNETAVIKDGDSVVGFQAKFFEDGRINPNQILESLEKVEKGQTKQIIYTNSAWGNPRVGNNRTKGQIRIEDKAKEIGIELEWLYGDNVLDLVQRNPLAYDVFFNSNSNLNHIQEDVNAANKLWLDTIKTNFAIGEKSVTIDRTHIVDELDELISNRENVLVSGESGMGKSAIVKMYCEKYQDRDDYTFYIINAGQLNTNAVNNLFSLARNYTLAGFAGYFKGTEHKVLGIDSAEKITELDNVIPFLSLTTILREKGWNFIFTCRDNTQDELTRLLKEKFSLAITIVKVDGISDDELTKLSYENGIRLPDDFKLRCQIHTPFFFARYCELGVEGQLNLKSFRKSVWEQKVWGEGSKARQLKRDHCLKEIVNRQLETVAYYIDYKGDFESATYLVSVDILGYEPHKGFFVKHDIYADWTLDYILYNELSDKAKVFELLNTTEPSFRYVNAFKRWYAECLEEESVETSYIGDEAFSGHDNRWTDAIMECIGSSTGAAAGWFDRNIQELEADNYKLFNHFVDILCVSCKLRTTIKIEGKEYHMTTPAGSGWEEAVRFIYSHIDDYYMKNLKTVRDFLFNFLYYQNAKGEKVELGGKLALHIFQVMAEMRRNGEDVIMSRNERNWSQLVCLYANEIKTELQQIFDEVVDNHWTHHLDPYYELVEHVLKGEFDMDIICISKHCYPQIIQVLSILWCEQSEDNDNNPFFDRGCTGIEKAFGLNESYDGCNAYFPESAFQTPILSLLNAENYSKDNNDITLGFIINFMNYAIDKYRKSNRTNNNIEIITVTLPDGSKHDIIANESLWCMYRGTSGGAMPEMLECMHMALESYLLNLLENTHDEKIFEKVNSMLWRILYESRSASLYAVVGSIAMSNINKFTDVLLFIVQDIRFLRMDLQRYSHETCANSLSFAYIGHERLWEERKKENGRKHRHSHLERGLLMMQAANADRDEEKYKKLFDKCQDVIKRLKEQVAAMPEREQWSGYNFIIARVDYASMKKEEKTLSNGQKGTQITPALTPEMLEESHKIAESSRKFLKGSNLRFWAQKRNEGDLEAIKNSPYERNPYMVLDTIHEILMQLDENGLSMNKDMGDEFLPGMASAVLLTQLSDKLTEETKAECRGYLFDALSHPEFQLSSSLSCFKVTLLGFPTLLDPVNKREQLQDILITYAEHHEVIANARSCDNVRFMIEKCRLWDEHEDFMRETLAKYQQKLQHGDFDTMNSEQALTVLSLLTTTPKNRELGNCCIEKMAALWKPNENNHYRRVRTTHIDAYVVAEYILRSPKDEVKCLISFYVPFIKGDSDYESFLSAFVETAARIGTYENFWIVWDSLYDNVVKNKNIIRRSNPQMLNGYMINPEYLTKLSDDWFRLEEKDVAFYARIAGDLPHHYTTLYAISRVFTSIGKNYVKQIVPVISSIIDGFAFHENASVSVISNMEKIMTRLFANYDEDIRKNKDLHDQVVKILEFMKKNHSFLATEFLKLV